ncbi:hypothetical protein NEMBOFW57_008165 [Staphylotrichum longicolle]|uniref:2EXR domain-containing protein n=1 Tax=Staphylotrichum longicolle TaxID=669026 RepID=A0AAD4HWD7_9PEZI|nr:hypothetical protein NEMBOFW57_008165 [Staphylotrichum longicolle]
MNSTITTAAALGVGPGTTPAGATETRDSDKPTAFFPFLKLPFEIRTMIYRMLLVSRRRIHLDCFLPEDTGCSHRLGLYTQVLRVCRQISAEALDVLYGENNFVSIVYDSTEPVISEHFLSSNLRRLRILTFVHPCIPHNVNVDYAHDYGSDLSDVSTGSWDSDSSSSGHERFIAPPPITCLPHHLVSILGNLTRLTLTLTVNCCHCPVHLTESIISNDEGLREYNSLKIENRLSIYEQYLSPTVKVHRRVWCSDHGCRCALKNKSCRRIQSYVKSLWLKDS